MRKYLFLFVLISISVDGFAGIQISGNGDENLSVQEILEKQKIINTLESDIAILDKEIKDCQKQKKGWIAATVIGGAGVLATGTAAIVQGVKIKDAKETITDKKQERDEAKTTLEELNK
ncbi:MAG: hypothetical protein MJ158_00420 [Alphaproteobacteria bacterium]|nr:hypothetical protein [Alphaproteobacteria bacterium]